eukprot:g12560.t1 g12560   contig6:2157501-2158990(-)
MKFINTSLLLLQATCLVALSSAASFYRSSVSHRRALTPSRHQQLIINIRGGQLSDGSGGEADGSYHGNYISSGGEPPKAAQAQSVAPVAPVATTQPVTPVQPHVTPAPTSIAGTKSQKLSNFQERAPPAIIMLGATALLLKYLGEKGMIGLVLVTQWAMYRESCAVVEDFNKSNGVNVGDDTIGSFNLQKWWWFATAVMFTSGRNLISKHTSMTMDKMNLITFGMTAVSLVGGVIQLAMVSSSNADAIYRNYLGKVACCHFSLLFLVGQSSFLIQTVQEYGLAWVLFPALLVIVNDTMAYVFGVLAGKHKLLPRLSPKKTVEGFVGAGFSTMAIAVPLLNKMVGNDGASDLVHHALVLAVYVSIVSPFGGFLASAVKRAHGAKDFGALIPGHGGVVDRFDCQVVTAPFVYLYLKTFFSAATAEA